MEKFIIRSAEWVVVCDGGRALLFENSGTAIAPALRVIDSLAQEVPPTREQGTDAPGRAFATTGTARSAVEQTDWHDMAEQQFLRQLAERLNEAVVAGKVPSLIMVAPPRALGVLRNHYSPALRQVLHQEIDKDLVKLPVADILRHITG